MTHRLNSRGLLAFQYFLYFGAMGIYLPFFNLYCYNLGFSGWQIGTLSAVRSVVLIVFSVLGSILADRFHARRFIYVVCNFCSAALWGLFLFTTDFAWMMVITVLHGVFYSPLIAFLEAFAMEVLGKNKKRYGRLRAWGSLAFIIVVLALGRIIETYTIKIIISLILAGSWVQALVSMRFPHASTPSKQPTGRQWRGLLNWNVCIFLVCAFLMLLSHGAYYAFFSIHLSNLGYDGFFIGLCWAVAVGAEIIAMVFSERIFKRFSYEMVLIVSFAAAVLRWSGLWVFDSAAAVLVLQLTHAVTYGTFHMASILYMDTLAPAEAKTIGQAANNAVTYGLGLMVGFFISGALYAKFGSPVLFGFSGMAAAVGGVLFGGYVVTRGMKPSVLSSDS